MARFRLDCSISESTMQHIKLIVHGLVQGVGFRYHTQVEARRLGLKGYVKNLPDGTVEITAKGEPDAIAALIHWAHQGPAAARVSQVIQSEAVPEIEAETFVIAR